MHFQCFGDSEKLKLVQFKFIEKKKRGNATI